MSATPAPFTAATIVGALPPVRMVPVPRAFTQPAVRGGSVAQAGTFMVNQGDLDALNASVGGTVAAYTQAILGCAGMSAPDQTAWTALGSSYTQTNASITEAETVWTYTWDPLAQSLRFGELYDQLQTIAAQLPTWQKKIAAACGSAPPAPVVPGGNPNPGSPQPDWASTVKWVAVAVVVVAGVYFLAPIAMTAIAFVPKPKTAKVRVTRTQWSDTMVLQSVDRHEFLTQQATARAFELADEGYIDTSGTWRLTSKGRQRLERSHA